MTLHFLNVNPHPIMILNGYFSPLPIVASVPDEYIDSSTKPYSSSITAFISNEDVSRSSDSSSLGWWWPENQLGFKNDQVKTQDKKSEINHHETIVRY